MTAIPNQALLQRSDDLPNVDESLRVAVDAACARIAPAWPLDRFIAVNPLWGHIDQPLPDVAAGLAALSGARLTLPRRAFREALDRRELTHEHLQSACEARGSQLTVDDVLTAAAHDEPTPQVLPLVTDLADDVRSAAEPQPWGEVVVHQISQHLASWFDRAQAEWRPDRGPSVFQAWRRTMLADRGLPIRGGRAAFRARLAQLPEDPLHSLAFVSDRLDLDQAQRLLWFDGMLASVRGWASACAWRRWEARLAERDDDTIVELLAMRGAWEWLLVEMLSLHGNLAEWRASLDRHESEVARLRDLQQIDWIFQSALELAFQQRLEDGLRNAHAASEPAPAPCAEAVFCIDVRSERFRRALEQRSQGAVRTRGFAGFFGLKIDFAPLGSEAGARPQLPGLLAPALLATQTLAGTGSPEDVANERRSSLGWGKVWGGFRHAATSAFTFVESLGLVYAWKLLRGSLPSEAGPARIDAAGLDAETARSLRPVLAQNPSAPDLAAQTDGAADVLRAMSLTADFPRLVLLAGHGSSSSNNPHAAGLDCGACGGHTGEVNARLLVDLLNAPAIREGLRGKGLVVPDTTVFVAGLHDTTTDELKVYEPERVPATHAADLQALRGWLDQAAADTRAERAPSLGLEELAGDPRALHRALLRRSSDWSQTRPEWGLADNAAFVVAPRARTRHMNLGGRVFLHDYDWQSDDGFSTLELILTAPMLVTHWINMQYHCSTTDNRQFGSGNKVLHNVVGGSLGVFEGNGGDLRIGLSMQSLHDGKDWQHTPLRLSVYVAAPRSAIEGVMARHEVVRNLVQNGWLHLFQLDEQGEAHRMDRPAKVSTGDSA